MRLKRDPYPALREQLDRAEAERRLFLDAASLLTRVNRHYRAEIERLERFALALAERLADQSEALKSKAEKPSEK